MDIIIEQIIKYVIEELGNEKEELQRLVKWINFNLKRRYPLQRKKYHEDLSEEIKKYKELMNKIKEIRETFQKGRPFVNNQTKGKRKQFTPTNMEFSTINFLLKYKGKDRALEEVRESLKSIKRNHSERSYYRLKKRLKEELKLEI